MTVSRRSKSKKKFALVWLVDSVERIVAKDNSRMMKFCSERNLEDTGRKAEGERQKKGKTREE